MKRNNNNSLEFIFSSNITHSFLLGHPEISYVNDTKFDCKQTEDISVFIRLHGGIAVEKYQRP